MILRTRIVVGLGAAVLALAGCGGQSATAPAGATAAASEAAPVVLRAATLRPGQPVPSPAGTPLLSLVGNVTAANAGSSIVLDRSVLAGLTQVQLRTYEPWVKQDLTFRGVWLADLLAVAGAPAGAAVRITALDDYAVTLSAADLRGGGILLATTDGRGDAIPVAQGGPTRIVFTAGLPAGANADRWIWSLRTIDVR